MTAALRGLLRGNRDVRAGLLVLTASMVGHLGNYLFYIVAARMLGASQFAEVSAIIAYALIVLQPLGGVQAAAARDVAKAQEAGDPAATSALLRSLTRWTCLVSLGITVLLLALAPLFTEWLRLSTWTLAVLGAVWVGLQTALVVGTGALQGMARFGRVAAVLAGPLGVLRTLLLPLLVLAVGISGSIWAMVLATVAGLALLWTPVRSGTRAPAPAAARFSPGTPVVMLLAFAVLTNLDVLAAKAALDAATVGAYSAAALMGKIALYGPQALTVVLLPRASAALARGESAARPVLATLAVTVGTGLLIAGCYALLPSALLAATFGPDFARSAGLLVPLALVMTLAAVVFVHLTFAIARDSRRFMALMVAAALAHAGALLVWHDSAAQIVAVTCVVVATTLVAIEVGSRFGAVRMLLSLRAHRAVPPA